MQTRRYPRTLQEAFRDAYSAGCIETPDGRVIGMDPIFLRPSLWQRLVRWLSRLRKRHFHDGSF